MKHFDFQPRTRVIFGAGAIVRLGELARELNFKRTLLVADHGLVASGHVDEAVTPLEKAGVEVFRFHDFEVNPDTRMVEAGTKLVAPLKIPGITATPALVQAFSVTGSILGPLMPPSRTSKWR